jgi:UDP-N-acetylmuramate dehydrogenase
MLRLSNEPFAKHTTLGLGGAVREWLRLDSAQEIADAVAEADAAGVPFVIVGGGSNLVPADEGFDGRVLHVANRGVHFSGERVQVAAGEPWDEFVAQCVALGLQGVECLSGIPGTSGATPIQNVGAYGQEVSDTIVSVEAYDREARALVTLTPAECRFAYRDSVLKQTTRWVVTRVTFGLRKSASAGSLKYAELVKALGAADGVPLQRVRETVIALRRAKGMVVDADDPESRSVGSFFTNPLLSADEVAALRARLGVDPPVFASAHKLKVAAAWLIERSGFVKGLSRGNVGISRKHSLALVNRGGGTTRELVSLAREIRDGVHAHTGVILTPEPILLGVTL